MKQTRVLDGIDPDEVLRVAHNMSILRGSEITVRPISGGLTNSNWVVCDETLDRTYFMKVPGRGTEAYIDRATSHRAAVDASEAGVGAKVLDFDPESGIEVTEFLAGFDTCTTAMLQDPELGKSVVGIYKLLHGSNPYPQTKTLFDMTDEHLRQVLDLGLALPGWIQGILDEYRDVRDRFIASGLDLVPSHNDPMPGNFMVDSSGMMKIIDFDFAANNERSCDLALFATEMFYETEQLMLLVEQYFGRADPTAVSRVQACCVVGDVKWGLWGLVNAAVRDVDFDYWKYGAWKLMRALNRRRSLDWDAVKANI